MPTDRILTGRCMIAVEDHVILHTISFLAIALLCGLVLLVATTFPATYIAVLTIYQPTLLVSFYATERTLVVA